MKMEVFKNSLVFTDFWGKIGFGGGGVRKIYGRWEKKSS
jgi:hypothetical protein